MTAASTDTVVEFPGAARGSAVGRRLIPGRLRTARLAKRMNLSELGEAIGKTRQAISSYELGEKMPEGSTLTLIAMALEQPIAYFTTPDRDGFGESGARFFRAFGAETKRRNLMCDAYAAWAVQVAKYIDETVNFPPVAVPCWSPERPSEGYSAEEIEAAADECRKAWGLGYGPLSNLAALAESKGIITTRLRLKGEGIEAFSFWNGPRPFIFLASEKDSSARARFDVAHEIAHLVLHQGVGQEEIEDPKILRRIEAEANRFAGALLLPRQSFPSEVFTTRLDAFKELKERWKVAIQAMVMRCRDLEIFDEYQVTAIYKQISARRWRTREPLDDLEKYPLEQPKLLRRAIELLITSGRKRREDIRLELALAPQIVEGLCNLPERSLASDAPLRIEPTLR